MLYLPGHSRLGPGSRRIEGRQRIFMIRQPAVLEVLEVLAIRLSNATSSSLAGRPRMLAALARWRTWLFNQPQGVHLDFRRPAQPGIDFAHNLHFRFLVDTLRGEVLVFDLRHNLAGAIRENVLLVPLFSQ